MKEFKYYAPISLDKVLDILNKNAGETSVIAGGTDLLINMNQKKVAPNMILDLKKVKELNFIKEENGLVRIGAMSTFAQVAQSKLINDKAKVLAQACNGIGSPQIRNLGTIGGNIINASPAADSVPALIALNAKAILKSKENERVVVIEDIFEDMFNTIIKENEILTEVFFETPNELTYSNFRKLGRRAALAISRISIAAVMEKTPEGNTLKDVRLSLGAVNKYPFRTREAEELLKGQPICDEKMEECVEKISEIAAVTLGSRASAPFKRESIKGIAREVITNIFENMNKVKRG